MPNGKCSFPSNKEIGHQSELRGGEGGAAPDNYNSHNAALLLEPNMQAAWLKMELPNGRSVLPQGCTPTARDQGVDLQGLAGCILGLSAKPVSPVVMPHRDTLHPPLKIGSHCHTETRLGFTLLASYSSLERYLRHWVLKQQGTLGVVWLGKQLHRSAVTAAD